MRKSSPSVTVVLIGLAVAFASQSSSALAQEKIFFSSNRAVFPSTENSHIWMINPDGTGMQQVTSGAVYDASPQLSPDGTRLLFTRFYSINPDCANIWVRELATGMESQVTFVPDGYNAAWSPGGSKIVFERTSCPGTGSEADLWTVDYPGGVLTPLPGGPGRSDPTWSPDGTNIVYGRGVGSFQLFKFTLPAGPDVDLIAGTSDERGPNYAPDGTKLVWYSGADTIHVAEVADPSGSQRLIASGFRLPAWSPDSAKVVLQGAGEYHLWVANDDGSSLTQVTFGLERDLEPWWGFVNIDVEGICPCSGPVSGGNWKNHGNYVSCVARASRGRPNASALISRAAKSSCGK